MTTKRFITFEGGDGAGKSTQVSLLVSRLEANGVGVEVVRTREPGGTPLGEELRSLVKGGVAPSPRAELLIFEAARAELVAKVIQPALDRGAIVVADRYADSSLAYQGYGRGLDLDEIRTLNVLATGGLVPGLTVLLDIAPGTGLQRSTGRDGADETQRRFEDEAAAFHERIRRGFLELAAAEPQRWLVLDASLPPEDIADKVWARVSAAVCADMKDSTA